MLLARDGRPLRRRVVAVAVAALIATAVSPGARQTAVAYGGKPESTMLAWGDNSFGQLGDGTTISRRTPVRVCAPGQTAPCTRFLTDVRTITAGGRHSLALRKDAALAWGNNGFGQLGDGTTTNRRTPVPVCAPGQTAPCTRFLTGVHAIDAGGQHSLALVGDQRPRH